MDYNPRLERRKAIVRSRSRITTLLAVYFFVALIIPNCVLANTEHYSLWTMEALILLPLGFYMVWSVALRRSGVMIWLGFPFLFLAAFQIILLYLFGNSIIATDMFTNLLTTNPGEAGELLSNIYPSIIIVCIIYLPLLWLAAREIGHKRYISRTARVNISLIGASLMTLGLLTLYPAYRTSRDKHVLRDEIFPINVLYNAKICAQEFRRMQHFERTSEGFRFNARRTAQTKGREIYVYVIGEASRAMNWQLFGYPRETNPELTQAGEGLVVFRNMLTQSNTTHKSVPLILSSVATDQHAELYRRKGLPALFREAGFETWFISNQSPQGAMIDKLAKDADHLLYIRSPRYDMQLLDEMQRIIGNSDAQKMLFVLHCYGSHFSYHQRYPREFARFKPDGDVSISVKHLEKLRNAYDNSICYTDHFLAQTMSYLNGLNANAALLYCADHGEDMLDDRRMRFLHASPTTTAYQIYVASLAWFSDRYRADFPDKVHTARENETAPATTHALFHTMAGIASIEGDHVHPSVSLVSPQYDRSAPRHYLNDHNEAVPYTRTGLTASDIDTLRNYGVEF